MKKVKWNVSDMTQRRLLLLCVLLAATLYAMALGIDTWKRHGLTQVPSTPLDQVSIGGLAVGQPAPENIRGDGVGFTQQAGVINKVTYEAPHLLMEQMNRLDESRFYYNGEKTGPGYDAIRDVLGDNYCIVAGDPRTDKVLYLDWENQLMLYLWHTSETTCMTLQPLNADVIFDRVKSYGVVEDIIVYPYFFMTRVLRGKLAPVSTYFVLAAVLFCVLWPVLMYDRPSGKAPKKRWPLLIVPIIVVLWHLGTYLVIAIARAGI